MKLESSTGIGPVAVPAATGPSAVRHSARVGAVDRDADRGAPDRGPPDRGQDESLEQAFSKAHEALCEYARNEALPVSFAICEIGASLYLDMLDAATGERILRLGAAECVALARGLQSGPLTLFAQTI